MKLGGDASQLNQSNSLSGFLIIPGVKDLNLMHT